MTIEMRDPKKTKVIKADYMLQAKVGSGPLDEQLIEACQKIIDENDYDFTPLAQEFLDKLSEDIQSAREGNIDTAEAVRRMTETVMQLKANAATFHYDLVSNLANVMLSFLEAVGNIDKDVVDIVDAHHRTLQAILSKKMGGSGGTFGKQLEDELKAACKRYFTKRMEDN